MQCSKCGADLRSGMVECPQCGAPVSSGGGTPQYRPGGNAQVQQSYVPGGGLPKKSEENAPAPAPQRPMGSLQRRLQRSQASSPNDYDDEDSDELWNARPPSRGGERSPHARQNAGPRGGQPRSGRTPSGNGYGERGDRSRPPTRGPRDDDSRYGSRGPAAQVPRGRDSRGGYDDESREAPAYSGGARWDEDSREAPAQRGGRDRFRPIDDSMEMSAEMSVESPAYPPARRPTPRRGSRPVDSRRESWDDPMSDPRAPMSGPPSRRPSQGGSSGRRGNDAYDAPRDDRRASRRPVDSYARYTEGDLGAPGYTDYGDSYGGYPDSRRGDPRQNGRAQRGRSGGYAPARGRDESTDFGAPAAGGGWGNASGYTGEYSGFGDSAWQPAQPAAPVGGGAGTSRATGRGGGAKQAPKAKRKRGLVGTIFWLFTLLVMAAGLGVELGPQVYHLAQRRGLVPGGAGTQANTTCGAEATPGASIKPAAGSTAFATTTYSLTYPTGWQKNAQSGSSQGQCDVVFAFSQPGAAAKLNVEQAGSFASLSDTQVIAAEAQSAQTQGSAFSEITSAATTQSIGGEVWQRHEYQVTTKDGTKLHLALLAGHHKGAGYAIILLSSDAGFASDDTTSFEPILKSFQFV